MKITKWKPRFHRNPDSPRCGDNCELNCDMECMLCSKNGDLKTDWYDIEGEPDCDGTIENVNICEKCYNKLKELMKNDKIKK